MVTTFNTKDLVSFGNFISQQIKSGKKQLLPDGEYEVTHADMENWKESLDRIRGGKVRAKFTCDSIIDDHEGVMLDLSAVTSEGQGENADYSKYTPFGSLKMKIDNGTQARDFFEEGKDYYLDFTKVVVD